VRLRAEDAEGGGRSSAPTLAGNFTLIGSISNLIVAQRASAGVSIGFWPYFKGGIALDGHVDPGGFDCVITTGRSAPQRGTKLAQTAGAATRVAAFPAPLA
jgi:hypothetical protein